MNEEKLKIAVFIDFDNIQIGVRSTLNRDFDLGTVLEALKERGEVVTKVAYGNWKRAGELTRTLTQNAVLMVQRDLTPRGDKNGADINLALDALEMAINHPHINAFVVVGGDSDFIALVEKLKQYNKAVFVVGGRSFTSSVLQRNCREFIAYENLVEADRRRDEPVRRRDVYPLTRAVPLVYRSLKVLNEREVQPQLGLLKSTLIQLDSTFNERDYGASSFRGFIQKLADAQLLVLRQQGNSYVVEPLEREPASATAEAAEVPVSEGTPAAEGGEIAPATGSEVVEATGNGNGNGGVAVAMPAPTPVPAPVPRPAPVQLGPPEEAMEALRRVLAPLRGTNPRPLYLRNIKQLLRGEMANFDEQAYGFGSLVDLLRAGQSQGWLRLQRDRRGALRVFLPSPPTAAGTAAAPAVEAPAANGAVGDVADAADPENANVKAVAPAPAEKAMEEDSQIALLGYYDHARAAAEQQEEELSLAAAVADGGGRAKRARKPKSPGGPRRGKKPAPR